MIKGLHDVVDVAFLFRAGEKAPQKGRLIGLGGFRLLQGTAITGPAYLSDHDGFVRKGPLQLPVAIDDEIHRVVQCHALPIRQDMRRDIVDVFGQFRVAEPDVPGFGKAHRRPDLLFDPVQIADHLRHADLFPQQGFVPHDDPDDLAIVVPCQFDEAVDLGVVALFVSAYPGAQGHVEVILFRQFRDLSQRLGHRIGPDGVGLAGQQGQVLLDLIGTGILTLERILRCTHGGEGEALNPVGPWRLFRGPLQQCPQTHGEPGDNQRDQEIGTKHEGWRL